MKSFASPSFFRLLDLMLSTTNPGLKLSRWKFDGVEFERERHSVMGPKHGLAIEIFTLTHAGRRGWTLMVTKEYWWAGEESKALKNLRWAPCNKRPARRYLFVVADTGSGTRSRTHAAHNSSYNDSRRRRNER
jgi:hypothetical protein